MYIKTPSHRKSPKRSSFVKASPLMVSAIHFLDFQQNSPRRPFKVPKNTFVPPCPSTHLGVYVRIGAHWGAEFEARKRRKVDLISFDACANLEGGAKSD